MIPSAVVDTVATAFNKTIKPMIGLLFGLVFCLIFFGGEIFLHLFAWTIIILALFCVAGIEYGEWNRFVPFTFYNEGTNIAFPIALAALIILVLTLLMYIVLTLRQEKDKGLKIFFSIFIFDMLWGYAYICLGLTLTVLLSAGFSFYRWTYLYVPAIVVAAHVLFILSVYTYKEYKKYRESGRAAW